MPRLTIPRALRGLPPAVTRQILALVAANLLIWAAAGAVLHFHPRLLTPAALAYTLGLRHALDADHIAAIDLTTRRLISMGGRPVSVGTWFSLGHSTVVVVTCVVVAATSGALRDRFDGFSRVGNVVGTAVSAAFLLVLCAGNAWVLGRLVGRLRALLAARRGRAGGGGDEEGQGGGDEAAAGQLSLEGVGFMASVFRKLFRIVDRPWKMYPLGVMFGLGFDTSSEIAILGIASLQGASGTSLWLILIFPVLFTAGMCLIDTTDGALMMTLYTSKAFARDHVAILYYSIVLTGITIAVSAFIGVVQLLTLVLNVAEPEGRFWDGVEAIGDHFEIIGGAICGLFLVVGAGSVVVYRPWRRGVDRRAALLRDEGGGGASLQRTYLQRAPSRLGTTRGAVGREAGDGRASPGWVDRRLGLQGTVTRYGYVQVTALVTTTHHHDAGRQRGQHQTRPCRKALVRSGAKRAPLDPVAQISEAYFRRAGYSAT